MMLIFRNLRRRLKLIYRTLWPDHPKYMSSNPKYSKYTIGKYTYGTPDVQSVADSKLIVGSYCSISRNAVILLGGEHRPSWISTYPFDLFFDKERSVITSCTSKGNVRIGNDVWIGEGVLILSGVTIGDGAVVAARSVVCKDVAPYSIVAGQPARHLRYRFSEEQCKKLLKIAWWNWPDELVRARYREIMSPDIDAFIQKFNRD